MKSSVKDIKRALFERDGARCSVCGKEITFEDAQLGRAFPGAPGGSRDMSNFRLECSTCSRQRTGMALIGYDFEQYMYGILCRNERFRNVRLDERIQEGQVIDLLAERQSQDGEGWEQLAIEVKFVPSFTYDRIQRVMSRRAQIQHFVPGAKFVLLFPGVLTDRLRMMLDEYRAEVWDRDYIWSVFQEQIEQAGHPVFTSALRPCRPSDGDSQTPEQEYIDRLWSCVPGKADWNSYQKTVGDILSYLFCPPLSLPLTEKSDAMHANRRDFIFPNYCDTGFWAFLRSRYGADYIVADAKNYSQNVSRKDILQMSNYLKAHGTGLFGMLIARKGVSDSAYYTVRELWALEKKLILIVHDNDLEQMLLEKESGREPENVIRQKIEDFRLSV